MAKTIKIRATLDSSGVWKGSEKGAISLDKFKKSAMGLASVLGVAGGAIGLVAALRASTTEFLQNELALKRTETQMKILGGSAMGSTDRLEKFIQKQTVLTGMVGAEVNDAFTRLLITTLDYNEAMRLTPLVLDMASVGLFNVESSARNLTRAMSGTVGELGEVLPEMARLIRELGTTAPAADKARVAMEYLNDTFGGAAQENLDTYTGKIERMKRILDEYKHVAGKKVMGLFGPGMEDIIQRYDVSQSLRDLGYGKQAKILGTGGFDRAMFDTPAGNKIVLTLDEISRRLEKSGMLFPFAPERFIGPPIPEGLGAPVPVTVVDAVGAGGAGGADFGYGFGPGGMAGFIGRQDVAGAGAGLSYATRGMGGIGKTSWEQPGFYQGQMVPTIQIDELTPQIDQVAQMMQQRFTSALGNSLSAAFQGEGTRALEQFAGSMKKMFADALATAFLSEVGSLIPGFGFLKVLKG